MGVGRPALRERLAAALCLLGTQRAAIVCGSDGLDEVTLNGPTQVVLVQRQALQPLTWTPRDFGLPETTLEPLLVDGPPQSASLILAVLAGTQGAGTSW